MLIGSRVLTEITEGDHAGASATVDAITGWAIWRIAVGRMAEFLEAEGDAELAALLGLLDFYEREARPAWNLEEPRGPIPATQAGLLRLPVPLVLALFDQWTDTFPRPEQQTSAVDETVPPGPVRDRLNEGLRKARKD